ncbi:hypothetical protein BJ912DRAFT_1058831 [Pholiota molesta]|nr:hypothetical protein BJ912DRAFT_1058831 [Pholiota molesta]
MDSPDNELDECTTTDVDDTVIISKHPDSRLEEDIKTLAPNEKRMLDEKDGMIMLGHQHIIVIRAERDLARLELLNTRNEKKILRKKIIKLHRRVHGIEDEDLFIVDFCAIQLPLPSAHLHPCPAGLTSVKLTTLETSSNQNLHPSHEDYEAVADWKLNPSQSSSKQAADRAQDRPGEQPAREHVEPEHLPNISMLHTFSLHCLAHVEPAL